MASGGAGANANEDPTDSTKHTNLLSLMCANYNESLTTPEKAENYLNETKRKGVFRKSSSDPNAITITYKTEDGKIQHSRINFYSINPDKTTTLLTMDLMKTFFPGQIGGRRSTRRHNKKRRSTRRR